MNTMEKNLLKSVSQSRRSNMLPSRKEIEEAVKNLSGQVSFAEQEGNRVKAIHTLLSLAQDVIDGSIFASEREMEDVLAQVGNNCYNEGKGISDTTIAIEVDNALKKLSGHISAPKSALTKEELIGIIQSILQEWCDNDQISDAHKDWIPKELSKELADAILSSGKEVCSGEPRSLYQCKGCSVRCQALIPEVCKFIPDRCLDRNISKNWVPEWELLTAHQRG